MIGTLPPWVIGHGIDKAPDGRRLYLTPTGWSPERAQACSFATSAQAVDWIEAARQQQPGLFRGAAPKPLQVEHVPRDPTDKAPEHLPDYDPYDVEGL